MKIDEEGIRLMEGKRKHRLSSAAAALAAATLLLTTGASSGAAVSSPLENAEEPMLYKSVLPSERSLVKAPVLLNQEAAADPEESREKAVPAGANEPESGFSPVPETEAVEDTYFDSAVFLGDSRTEGLYLYSGLKTGHFYTAVGATVESVFTKKAWETGSGGKIPLLDAVAKQECDKIYIMLGINELGWTKTETFHDQYAKVIERIREDHPEAKIALQSIPPVSAKQEAKRSYVNNARILIYNEVIKTLAEEMDCYFLDVAECLTDEDGLLSKDWNFDGIHLNPAGCGIWLNYLRTHSLEDEAAEQMEA